MIINEKWVDVPFEATDEGMEILKREAEVADMSLDCYMRHKACMNIMPDQYYWGQLTRFNKEFTARLELEPEDCISKERMLDIFNSTQREVYYGKKE